MSNFLGIDLGKQGAAVLLDPHSQPIGAWPTPLLAQDYDGMGLLELLKQAKACGPCRAFVEQPMAIAQNGIGNALTVGMGFGRWCQTLDVVGIGFVVVPANRWTTMWLPPPKKRKGWTREQRKDFLFRQARTRWPEAIAWDRFRTDQRSGLADAALLAEWGRVKG
jgi:hypothetical protein